VLTPQKGFLLVHISHDRAKKGNAMLLLFFALVVFALVRAVQAAAESLRGLPRSNEDWIWF
jgi:hypothetical protein